MRSKQRTAELPPANNETRQGLMLGCGNCGSFRVFKVQDNMGLVGSRKASGFLIQTECENCQHKIAAWLGWIDDAAAGYSYRAVNRAVLEPGTTVEDENGLKVTQGKWW